MVEANARGGFVLGPAPWALFLEEGARAALEMAVVSAAVR
jgi:hypothetical protein